MGMSKKGFRWRQERFQIYLKIKVDSLKKKSIPQIEDLFPMPKKSMHMRVWTHTHTHYHR